MVDKAKAIPRAMVETVGRRKFLGEGMLEMPKYTNLNGFSKILRIGAGKATGSLTNT